MAKPLLLHATTSLPLRNIKNGSITEEALSCSYPTPSKFSARGQNLGWSRRGFLKLQKAARSLERLGLGNRNQFQGRAHAALQQKDGVAVLEEEPRSAAMETLDLLEWPQVCRAVASFAATSLAKEQLQVLEIPATRDASEALLELTSAGVELISLLGGPFELGALRTQVVKDCVLRTRKGMVVTGIEALSVAMLLQMGRNVRRQVFNTAQEHQDRQSGLQPLLEVVGPIAMHPDLDKSIWRVIDEDGSVKDSASPELRKARIQERSVEQRLRELFNKLTREKSGSDGQSQTDRQSVCKALALLEVERTHVLDHICRSGRSTIGGYSRFFCVRRIL